MKEIRISSIQDFIEKTLEDSYNIEIQRYRTSYVFRGMSDKDWKLDNTLMRNSGSKGAELEVPLIRNFSKYAAKQIGEIPGEISIWKKLATAQHYGLPTRLLDWSYNPLVALHFATNKTEEYGVDGVVWGLNFFEAREVLPEKLKKELDQSSAFVFTNEMLIESVKDLSFSNVPSKDNYLLFYDLSIGNIVFHQFHMKRSVQGKKWFLILNPFQWSSLWDFLIRTVNFTLDFRPGLLLGHSYGIFLNCQVQR